LTKEGGYDEIVIEDFYDVFLENVENLAKLPEKFQVAKKAGYKNSYQTFVVQCILQQLPSFKILNI
jgi:hypothetical protein